MRRPLTLGIEAPDGRAGLAHFVEHMMFNGSKHAAGKFMDFVQQAGANLAEGGVNGTTNHDRTNYFESVPPQNLEHILWLESDRLATLPEVLTVQRLEAEREIIKNERRQRIEGRPYGRAETLMVQNVFRAPHPYSHDVLGNPDDLMAIDVGDMTEFFNTYYTPNNLSLVIAGDFDPAKQVVTNATLLGSINNQAQYPFAWQSSGCALITLPLKQPITSGKSLEVDVFVGPNYDLQSRSTLSHDSSGGGPPAP